MLRYIIVISMVISMCFASGAYRRCADGKGELPLSATVRSGNFICTQSPCIGTPNVPMGATIEFTSTAFTNTLTPIPRFYVGTVSGVYDLPEEKRNGCNWLTGSECPLDIGEDVTYDLDVPVPNVDESAVVAVEFSLLNDDEVPQFCFIVDIKLVY